MHDRYRGWYPRFESPVRPISRISIEEQVLKDLSQADSEGEKLEILDSYFIYAQRVYRSRMVMGFSDETGSLAAKISRLFFQQVIPEIFPPVRVSKAPPIENTF